MNQLYASINESAQADTINSAELIKDWWAMVKALHNENHLAAMAAAMIYGGHAGLLTQDEYEDLVALATKAHAKLQEKMAVSQTIRTLHATLNKAKPQANGEES